MNAEDRENLIRFETAVENARTPHHRTVGERHAADLRTQIETRVTQLFGLSDADMDIVRAVPIPD